MGTDSIEENGATNETSTRSRISRFVRSQSRTLLVLAWVAATAFLIVSLRKLDWVRAGQVLTSVKPAWVVVAIALNAAILAWWAGYWRALQPIEETRIGFNRMFEITATASALMNTVPFGGGLASSVVLLVRRGGFSQRGALALVALDQLGEGIAKVGIFVLTALLLPLPTWMQAGIVTASIAVGALFIILVVASRWAAELRSLDWRRAARALACIGAMKVAEACAIIAVQHALGVTVGATGTLLVLSAVILGSMIPVSPGNLGTYEASAFLAYRSLGVAPEQAMSLALVQHFCFMLPAIGIGYSFISAQTVARRAIASR